LNSPDPPFSFILPNMPLPPFQEQFQKVLVFHLHTCGHITCTTFTLPHPSSISSPSHWYQYQVRPVLPSCF
jgi:hypothetical protein